VFDIDGVVADVRHRVHYLERGYGAHQDWDSFFLAADEDTLLTPGRDLVSELSREHEIVWLTGRPEWIRKITHDWLEQQGLPNGELHMRDDMDFRPAPRYKLSVLRQLSSRTIAAFIDDDDAVVRAALAAGYPTHLADWVARDSALREAQDDLGRS
jgi:uncharacterized HAD superfamily protein